MILLIYVSAETAYTVVYLFAMNREPSNIVPSPVIIMMRGREGKDRPRLVPGPWLQIAPLVEPDSLVHKYELPKVRMESQKDCYKGLSNLPEHRLYVTMCISFIQIQAMHRVGAGLLGMEC